MKHTWQTFPMEFFALRVILRTTLAFWFICSDSQVGFSEMLMLDWTGFKGSRLRRDILSEFSELEDRIFLNCCTASGELSGSDSSRTECDLQTPLTIVDVIMRSWDGGKKRLLPKTRL